MRFLHALFAAIVVAATLLPLHADAHGMMTWPRIRLQEGDASNGYTQARAANTAECGGLGPGVATAYPAGPTSVEYVVTAHHGGVCHVLLKKDGDTEWTELAADAQCGDTEKKGKISINLPDGEYNGVLRWFYKASITTEEFNSCADIRVSKSVTTTPTPPPGEFDTCLTESVETCASPGVSATWYQCTAKKPSNSFGFDFPKQCGDRTVCLQKDAGLIECGLATSYGSSQAPQEAVASPLPTTSPTTVADTVVRLDLNIAAVDPNQQSQETQAPQTTGLLHNRSGCVKNGGCWKRK